MPVKIPQFLVPDTALSAEEIAYLFGGEVIRGSGDLASIDALSSIAEPKPGSLVYVATRGDAYHADRLNSVAIILCDEGSVGKMPGAPVKIVVDAPHLVFAKIGRRLFPDSIGSARVTVSGRANASYPQACVSDLAMIEDGAVIEAGCVVGDRAAIGRDTVLGANTVVANNCQIGRNCHIGFGVTVQFALIGDAVTVHGGAQIGQEGFGFIPGPGGLEKVPQMGRVIIQNNVEIGANTTIDRGTLDDTVIGEGTKIDNLVQIAHNTVIGRNCVIAAHAGLSGSVTLGDGCMLGGRVGVADHVSIGSHVQIAASSGVMNDIPDGQRWAGTPAQPFKEFFRETAALRKLAGKDKKPKL